MYSALRGTDPVIFFESQRLYGLAEEFVGNWKRNTVSAVR
jgi:pyruvate/2-oxoglutarate/acetoin dehydrogenase E1 component